MGKKVKWVKIGLSALFFVVLYRTLHGKLLIRISDINYLYMMLSFLLIPLMLAVSCLKWKIVLRGQGWNIKFLELLRIYLIGYFFSNLLPSNVGGDVVRSYYVGRKIDAQSDAAVSVFIERFSGVLCILILVVLSPLVKVELYRELYVLLPVCLASFILLVFFWLWKIRDPFAIPERLAANIFLAMRKSCSCLRIGFAMRLVDMLERIYSRVMEFVRKFHAGTIETVGCLREDGWRYAWVVLLTLGFYSLTWLNVYLSFKAFGVDAGFVNVIAVLPAIMLLAMIPVTVLGNLGFTESLYVVFFGIFGLEAAGSLAMALLLRLKMLVLGVTGYLFYLAYSHRTGIVLKIGDLSRGDEDLNGGSEYD